MADIVPVASGEMWIGYGVRSFHSTIHELISESKEHLVMTVYILSNKDIVNDLEDALQRGIGVDIYIYEHNLNIKGEAIRRMRELEDKYSYLNIRMVENEMLHAKVLVADGSRVIAGSANLTQSGMIVNYELGFLVNNPTIATNILNLIRRLDEQ